MMRRTPFKRHAPKKRPGHDKTMLTACKGELCYLRIPGVCIGGMDTTVPAHSNQAKHGKGMGIKARDEFTVPACMECHYAIDQSGQFSKKEKFAFWEAAYSKWQPVREMKLAPKNNPASVVADPGLSTASI